jgi:hypothetical protein
LTVRRALSAATLAAWVASACDPALSLDEAIEGKRCRTEQPRCLEGYVCDVNETCVLRDALGAAGAGSTPVRPDEDASTGVSGGNGGVGGNTGLGGAGSASGEGGSGGDPDTTQGGSAGSPIDGAGAGGSGTDGSGGSGGSGVAAAGGASVAIDDAGSIQPEPPDAGPCVPVPLYRDLDGDGHGSGPEVANGCPGEGLSAIDDDCHDALPSSLDRADLVYPGQTRYFDVGYRDESKPGNISFDYDCVNGEEADPENRPDERARACNLLPSDDLTCVGTGYEPGDRGGFGINSLCGSRFIITCVPDENECRADSTSTEIPFRCR